MGARKTIPRERLREIERRLLRAEAPADFVPELATLWEKSERSLWRYTERARARLAARAKAAQVSPEADAEIVRAMLLETYRDARGEGDRKTQVAAAYRYAEVTGAKRPQRVDVTSGGQPLADAHAHLAAALARLAQEPDAGAAGDATRDAATGDG